MAATDLRLVQLMMRTHAEGMLSDFAGMMFDFFSCACLQKKQKGLRLLDHVTTCADMQQHM